MTFDYSAVPFSGLGQLAGSSSPSLDDFGMAAVFAALPGAYLLLTPDLRIVAVSDAYVAITLNTRDQLVGQSLFDAFGGAPGTPENDTMANLRASLEQTLATRVPHDMPVQYYRIADPTLPGAVIERFWQPRNTPVLGVGNTVSCLIHSVADVTERHRATVSIRESAAREQAAYAEAARQRDDLLRLLEQTPVAIGIIQGPDFIVEQANPALGAIWGRPAAEMVGQPFFEALPDLRNQGFEELFTSILARQHSLVLREVPVMLAPDSLVPATLGFFNCVYQPWRNAQGERGFIAVAVNVTDQVLARQQVEAQQRQTQLLNEEIQANSAAQLHAQEQLRQLNDELETRVFERTQALLQVQAATEQEWEQLYQVFEQTSVAIAIMRGPNLRVELANPAVAAIWGREPAQVVGRPYFEAVPDTAGQGFEQILLNVLATGEPFTINEAPVTLARAHTGLPTQAYVNFVFQPLRDATGTTVGLVASGTEVTEQVLIRQQVQLLNQELGASNGKLQASNAELATSNDLLRRTNTDLDTFVYTASHDLKVPIANIEGLLDVLVSELSSLLTSDMVTGIMGMMRESVARFQQTIGHLTDISRLQQEGSSGGPAVSLAAIIADVELDLAPLLHTTGAQLTVELTGVPTVPLSPKNLRSVVYNLLSNALKYRAPDRVPVVRVQCYSEGRQVVLTVQDNGLGLDEHQQLRLFGLFQRLHSHVEGSGVGLYMVKKIVENAGGTVQLRSRVGAGSTFSVTLPLSGERTAATGW